MYFNVIKALSTSITTHFISEENFRQIKQDPLINRLLSTLTRGLLSVPLAPAGGGGPPVPHNHQHHALICRPPKEEERKRRKNEKTTTKKRKDRELVPPGGREGEGVGGGGAPGKRLAIET